jgi:cell division protein FtsB
MFDFHEKRKMRTVLYSRPVVFVIMLVTVLLSFSAYNRYSVAKDMEQKLDVKKQELRELEERARHIESKVEYLADERGVEEELRNRFDAIREGEQVIILLDDADAEKKEVKQSESVDAVDTEESFLRSLWSIFKFW